MSSSVMDPRQDSTELEQAPPTQTAAGIESALCELLFHSASAGVGVVDRELRFVRVNDALAAMNGRPAAAHIGLSIFDVIPHAAPTLAPFLRRVIETGEPMLDLPIEVEHPAGVWRRLSAGYYPVRDGSGAVTGIASVTLEHQPGPETERRAVYLAAREADRARVLRGVVTRLNEAITIPQVASAVVDDTLRALDGDGGLLMFVSRDAEGCPRELVWARSAGYEEALSAQYERIPIMRGRPTSELALTGVSLFVESLEQCRTEWPSVSATLEELGFHAFAAVPVKLGDQVVAALTFTFRKPRQFDNATREFLATLGEQCALALERVRLHEAELRAAERQAAILATVQDGFAVLDRELRFTYVNAQAEALLHKPAQELLGRRLGDVFPQAVGKPVEQAMRRVLETGERQQAEAYSPVVQGWVDARLYPAPDGLSIVFQDVSSRKRRQDSIALLADASRQLATSLDYHQTIRTVVAAAVPMLGDLCVVSLIEEPEKGEWPPRLERIAASADGPETVAHVEALSNGYAVDWSSTVGLPQVLRTGTPVFVQEMTDARLAALAQNDEHLALMRALNFSAVIMVPLVARGTTLGALSLFMTTSGRQYDDDDLVVARDLADRQALAVDNARLLHQAQRACADAETANRAKTEFLAVMSYELRTPLNAIAGYARILDLELHGPVTDPQRIALERIRRSQMHLAEIINQVLSFARLESGTVVYELKPLRLGELIADLMPRVEHQRATKRLALQVRMPAPSADHQALVLADADKLEQVILNLLSNAVKFSTAGGQVTVEVLADPHESNVTLLRVIDTGIGIPRSELESIFEPFVQVDRSLNHPGEGTGLGLAISRVLARGMGGDLTVTSTPGAGSTFTLRLPRA